ncbi:tRNA (adenosine(37)-N6)-threonylcarbamoyltransferase complex transferase subunit TsaD [Desulfosudis oleivorans]|nr:tRNA (adenosine(37)-N6)-threonylcarbamoyltransferase complex transferase subunit TsaD [Desulfosudis oleivorans]
MKLPRTILGIETSCDETGAAVVADGRRVLSSVVSSQVALHSPYGGVVPELASRKHIEHILPVVRQALAEAGLKTGDIDAVAATQGPGLVGALLVGFSFAKAFAYAANVPMVGVNHLNGHLASLFLTDDPPAIPFVALLASGGHTAIYHVTGPVTSTLMGQTRDDAAGEAYDKVAKMMGLGYPGGAVIDNLAAQGDPAKYAFTRPYLDKAAFDFSFSGIKTAARRFIQEAGDALAPESPHIAAGFQEAVADVLCYKLVHAAKVKKCGHMALVGGVAANRRIGEKLRHAAKQEGLVVHIPPPAWCGDNAAMIGAAGFFQLAAGAEPVDLSADVYSRVA